MVGVNTGVSGWATKDGEAGGGYSEVKGPLVACTVDITWLELFPPRGTLYVSGMSARIIGSFWRSRCKRTCLATYNP